MVGFFRLENGESMQRLGPRYLILFITLDVDKLFLQKVLYVITCVTFDARGHKLRNNKTEILNKIIGIISSTTSLLLPQNDCSS